MHVLIALGLYYLLLVKLLQTRQVEALRHRLEHRYYLWIFYVMCIERVYVFLDWVFLSAFLLVKSFWIFLLTLADFFLGAQHILQRQIVLESKPLGTYLGRCYFLEYESLNIAWLYHSAGDPFQRQLITLLQLSLWLLFVFLSFLQIWRLSLPYLEFSWATFMTHLNLVEKLFKVGLLIWISLWFS